MCIENDVDKSFIVLLVNFHELVVVSNCSRNEKLAPFNLPVNVF